jgi:hypothetical protein
MFEHFAILQGLCERHTFVPALSCYKFPVPIQRFLRAQYTKGTHNEEVTSMRLLVCVCARARASACFISEATYHIFVEFLNVGHGLEVLNRLSLSYLLSNACLQETLTL